MYRLLTYMVLVSVLGVTVINCDGPDITNKQFECEKDADCQKAYNCKNGKCELADSDKDGWAKNKDCNDSNRDIYPGAPEICDNGADDNCDGQTDEQPCQCQEGATRACGPDKGICKPGQETCRGGTWSKCVGMIGPQEEVCDGKDNDCDGSIDEEVPNCCQPDQTQPCGSDQGECQFGVQTCQVGKWTECKGGVQPVEEVCDGKDNDCDGKVDNIKDKADPIRQPCYSGPEETRGKGECKDGYQLCQNAQWGLCQQDTLPATENCDGKDNDCDGKVDNLNDKDTPLEQECYSGDPSTKGKGECKAGTQRCVGGSWSACIGEVPPGKEACNNTDDDCDGQVDNTAGGNKPLSRACYSGAPDTRQKGVCKDGTQECVNGRWSSCKGDKLPDKELCDTVDNDCDGRVDNINGKPDLLTGPCYEGPQGTQGKGTCKDGVRSCVNGNWTSCSGQVWPSKEVCDGKDNDCNGSVDDNLGTPACNTGKPGECSKGKSLCISGKPNCVQAVIAVAELCNGKDDDCDGSVDEGNPGGGGNCNVPGARGLCIPGKQVCQNKQLVCKQQVFAKAEICNQKDDDCDGTVDDNTTDCPAGTQCQSGTCRTCSQPSDVKCANFDLFCVADAKDPPCRCGFKPYCKQPSSSIFCSGCCAIKSCR